jgi:hypothetical protein
MPQWRHTWHLLWESLQRQGAFTVKKKRKPKKRNAKNLTQEVCNGKKA